MSVISRYIGIDYYGAETSAVLRGSYLLKGFQIEQNSLRYADQSPPPVAGSKDICLSTAALRFSMQELNFDGVHWNGSPQHAQGHRDGYDRNAGLAINFSCRKQEGPYNVVRAQEH